MKNTYHIWRTKAGHLGERPAITADLPKSHEHTDKQELSGPVDEALEDVWTLLHQDGKLSVGDAIVVNGETYIVATCGFWRIP